MTPSSDGFLWEDGVAAIFICHLVKSHNWQQQSVLRFAHYDSSHQDSLSSCVASSLPLCCYHNQLYLGIIANASGQGTAVCQSSLQCTTLVNMMSVFRNHSLAFCSSHQGGCFLFFQQQYLNPNICRDTRSHFIATKSHNHPNANTWLRLVT